MTTIKQLIKEITALKAESEWVEFKENNSDPENIGEYISAMANTSKLMGQPYGYLVWGIDDKTRNMVGAHFSQKNTKIGNEELENWLIRLLHPRIDFRFYEEKVDEKNIVILAVPAANHIPVRFKDTEYIRVGSYKKKLKEYPEKERNLWKLFERDSFELEMSISNLTSEDVLGLLDYTKYFELVNLSLPDNREGILNRLKQENLIQSGAAANYHVSNLGGILFSKDLINFPKLNRKKLRIVQYKGDDRTSRVNAS